MNWPEGTLFRSALVCLSERSLFDAANAVKNFSSQNGYVIPIDNVFYLEAPIEASCQWAINS